MTYQGVFCRRIIAIIFITVVLVFPAIAGEREEYTFAFKLFQDEKYIFAKDQFKAYLENYPEGENADDARFLLGECALRLEDYDDAILHYKKLTANPASPLRLDAVRGVATAWFHQGRYEEAIKAYEEVIKGSKDDNALSRSLYLVGESYDNLGLYQKAVEYYNRVLRQFPKSAEAKDALYGTAWGLFRLEDYKAAYKAFAEFVKTSSNHPAIVEASYRAAESLFKFGDWENAQAAYQNLIDTYRDNEEHREFVINARYRLGECYFQQRMMEKAKNTFNLLLHESGASSVAPDAQYWIAEILLEQGKYVEAIHEYQKVKELYPRSDVVDDAQFGIATVHFLQEDYAQARSQFKVVADNPRSDLADPARFRIGECFRLQREFNSAILNYKKVSPKSVYADDALYGFATSAFQLRDYAETVRTLNALLQSHPSSPLKTYALYQLALAYFHQKEYGKCVEALNRHEEVRGGATLETAPADEVLIWKARALYELEDYQATIRTCERLIREYPKSSVRFRAEFFIAESTYWSDQTVEAYRSARSQYQSLLSKQPAAEWAEKCRYGIGWTHLSEAAASSGQNRAVQYQEAINAWAEVVKHHPRGEFADAALYQSGVVYTNLKQYSEGIEAFNQILSDYPGSDWHDNARYQIGRAYYKQEKYPEAIIAFNDMLREHSGSPLVPKAIFGTANAYFKQSKFNDAIRYYQQVVEKFPNQMVPVHEAGAEPIEDLRPEAQYYSAESYLNLADYLQAIRAYEQVIQHYPKNDWADDAQYGIAVAYENLGQKEKAVQAYQTLMVRYADGELAHAVQLQIARFYYQDKDYKRAIAEFQKVINQYPKTASAWLAQYNIGKCYLALDSYRQAIQAFERVDPRSEYASTAAFEIGNAWYDPNNQRRNLGNAVEALRNVLINYPDSPDAPRALLLAGQCYEELVQWDEAIEMYRYIIAEYPNSKQAEVAQLVLGHAHRSAGNYVKAIEAYDVIREGGVGRYPPHVVIEGILHMAETQSLMSKHRDAATSYLRVFYLYKEHDPLSALTAAVRAGDAFADATQLRNARDEYQRAVTFYESQSSVIQDSPNKKSWDKLYNYAREKLEQVTSKINQN